MTTARAFGASLGMTTLLTFVSAAAAQQAQREPVLSQVKVPHAYYWREMYVPQATSGPSAVTWSPDGRDVIYSMQGSLWRQRLGTTEARQLTTGPWYDYQPDWSPDGRSVVFASYNGESIDLRALDLERGTTADVIERAKAKGLRVGAMGAMRIRAVIHLDVDRAGVQRAAQVIAEIAATL